MAKQTKGSGKNVRRPGRDAAKRAARSKFGRSASSVKVKAETVATRAAAGSAVVPGKQIGGAKRKATKNRTGNRDLTIRVKSARGRKVSSTAWLQRQLNDPYVIKAKVEGYRSRAAFKLAELNERHKLIKPGMRIVDLGCAPGGWCQVAAKIVGESDDDPRIVGIDILEMDPIPGVKFLCKDFTQPDAPDMLLDMLDGHKVDIVLSDMAAATTGHRPTDHIRIIYLCEIAVDFAMQVLKPGGTFVSKVLQGGTEHELLSHLKKNFDKTYHAKPPASRKDSAETYLIASGYKGGKQPD